MSEPRRRGDSGPPQEPICVTTLVVRDVPGEQIVVHVFSFLAVPGAPPSDTRLVTHAYPGSAHYYTYDCAKGHLQRKWLYDVEQPQPTTNATLAPPFEPRVPALAAQVVSSAGRERVAAKAKAVVRGDLNLTADVVQEVAVRALTHSGKGEIGNPEAYLVGMTRNAAMEELRARFEGPSLDDVEEHADAPGWVAKGTSPLDGLVGQETASLVWAKVAQLPQRRKETAVLVLAFGLSHAEAASLLGTSHAVTRDAVRHARRALQESLRPAQ